MNRNQTNAPQILLTVGADGVFYAKSDFESRNLLRYAGFQWHEEYRCWFTTDLWVAAKFADHADLTAQHAIFEAETRLYKSSSAESNLIVPAPEGRTYRPYQVAGIDYCSDRKFSILADEPGLGKTIMSAGVMNLNNPKRTIVVCPAVVKINWRIELNNWLVKPHAIQIVEGRKCKIDPDAQVYIVNYDLLSAEYILMQFNQLGGIDLLIIDECHYLKSSKALRTKAILQKRTDLPDMLGLVHISKQTMALSGTPIVNRPVEFWPLLGTCAKEVLRPYDDWLSFIRRYCGARKGGFGWITTGATHMDDLNKRLRANCMIRRRKEDVLTELPALDWKFVSLPQTAEIKKLISKELHLGAEMLKGSQEAADFAEWQSTLPKIKLDKLAVDPEKPIVAQLAELRQQMTLAKMPNCIEYILELLSGVDKLVIFAVHKEVVRILAEHLAEFKPLIITGDTHQNDRQKAVDLFQSNPAHRVFIGNIQAAGVGITLTAANHVVFVEVGWTPGELEQAADRCHRFGQKNAVTAHVLSVENSMDHYMMRTVVDKQKVLSKVLA